MQRALSRIVRLAVAVFSAVASDACAPAGLLAQEVPALAADQADVLQAWKWRNLGPNRGGRSIAVAGSSSRPNEYYFGATGGGLWKTTDGGTTWAPVSDGWFSSASVGAIGLCQANPDVVYAGTGEIQFRGTIATGDGVYSSHDGGKTWDYLGLASSTGQQTISRIRVHPTDCDIVYAAVLGDPYGPNPERGVFRSGDGGATWEKVLYRNDHAGAADLSMDPSDPATLYATIWDVVRKPWGGKTGDDSGIFKTVNAGDTWQELTHNPGLPRVRIGKVGISVSGADPNRVYAVIAADPEHGGVFRSDDGGVTWMRTSAHHALFARAEYYTRIVADPRDPDRVYVLAPTFFRSDDGGYTYTQVPVPHGDNHDLWIAPNNNQRMIEANDGGANVSINGGRTWTEQDYPTAQIYHVTTTSDFPYHVCGAQQDNSTACVPSDGDGSYWYHVGGGESGYIAVRPDDPNIIYAGSYRGYLTRYDRRTGQARNVQVWPLNSQGESAGMQRERVQWTFPIEISPHDPDVIYTATQHVWRTENGGQSWDRVSPDLTRADPATIEGSQLIIRNQNTQDHYATIFALALSPHDRNTIWAGSDDGLVHVTRDGGESWHNITPSNLPDFARVSMIEPSPHTPGKAYLAVERHKMQDITPYLFRTENYGTSWTRIAAAIPNGHYLRAIREDPGRRGLLFAGTEHGPYVSYDDGAVWHPLALNLPDVQVSDLKIKKNDVVISTYGRSMWILEGILPVLRELSGEVLAQQWHLFPTADAIRTQAQVTLGDGRNIYDRTTIPGANQVRVAYYLREPAREVRIDFLDGRGRLIRSFARRQGEPGPEAIRDSVGNVINGPRWGQELPPRVEMRTGIHIFPWNMRPPPAKSAPGMLFRGGASSLGPLVPPGDYRVRVTVDSETRTSDFRIRMDPRLTSVTLEDLQEQYDLAIRIHERLDEASSAVLQIREIRRQIRDRLGRTPDRGVRSAGEAIVARLSEIEEELYPVGVRSQKGPLHFGGRLINEIGSLLHHAVESADVRPTRQSYEVFDLLSAKLDTQLAALRGIMADDVSRFNDLLRQRGLPPVAPTAED